MNLALILGVIGAGQILIISVVLLLLLGGKRVPELMRGIGEGVKEYKKTTKTTDNEDQN